MGGGGGYVDCAGHLEIHDNIHNTDCVIECNICDAW